MSSFFFPCVGLIPNDLPPVIEADGAALRCREWQTTAFDFATLGASHKLHFSWHLLDVFMGQCNLEIEIRDVDDFGVAQERVRVLQSMLYLQWVSPFIIPVGMSHGLRDYSGLNHRDSPALRDKLPVQLQTGFTSSDGQIEGWLHEPSLECIAIQNKRAISAQVFLAAASAADQWRALEQKHHPLSAARRALQTSPMIPDLSSSVLHAWQGIEALFPRVSSEVSFRLALLVSQLCAPVRADRMRTYGEAKRSYNQRSRAAHGNGSNLTYQSWHDAWDLLILCLSTCLHRDELPTEEMLTLELLG